MHISINALCSNRIYSNWRGDLLNTAFAFFCIVVLLINLTAVLVSLLYKQLRVRNSVRLFALAFCGNISTIMSIFITTVLRLYGKLTCKALQVLYVFYQYGMSSSSFALLILVYVNLKLAKKKSLQTKGEKKSLSKKIMIWCSMTTFGNLLFPAMPVIFESQKIAFLPTLLFQIIVDVWSIVCCISLSREYSEVTSRRRISLNPTFTRKVKASVKLILPAVAITNAFKFSHLIINFMMDRVGKSTFSIIAHLHTIYFVVFIIVPCFYLKSKRRIIRPQIHPASRKFSVQKKLCRRIEHYNLEVDDLHS